MYEYEPGVFSSLYETPIGFKLWDFLNERENIVRMETATALECPAVEGIEEPLLKRFKEAVLDGRTKQMIGHMVRQIMERKGYIIAAQNVKITNGAPFSRATRYKRPQDMTFHVFRNKSNSRTVALTVDKAGSRLTAVQGEKVSEWHYWKKFRGSLRGRIAFGLDDEAAAKADIAKIGYHIYELKRILRPA